MSNFTIVGAGPGHPDYILPAALKRVEACTTLIGGRRNLELFKKLDKKTLELRGNITELVEYIKANKDIEDIVVIVSGDPGFYSLLNTFLGYFDREEISVEPGLSSLQYLLTKVTIPWQMGQLISFHGREHEDFEYMLKNNPVLGILTDSVNNPAVIAEQAVSAGFGNRRAVIGEKLSYEDEKITDVKLPEVTDMLFDKLSVMVIYEDR